MDINGVGGVLKYMDGMANVYKWSRGSIEVGVRRANGYKLSRGSIEVGVRRLMDINGVGGVLKYMDGMANGYTLSRGSIEVEVERAGGIRG